MTKELTLNKVAAGLVGVAMVAGLAFAAMAERAHAITLSELVELFIALEVIPADKADEARAVLQGQDDTTTGGGVAMSCNFTRSMGSGTTGADVMELQRFLNAQGFTVAVAGAPGSAGNETQYYGPATAAAVTAFQNAYASEVLAPLGLTAGTGYFGASSRAKANDLCSDGDGGTTPPPPPPPPAMDDDDDDTPVMDDDDDDTLSGGEASLEDFKRLGSPASVDVAENEEDVKVAGWEWDVKDADARLSRVDVRFEATTGNSNFSYDPWDYFESVSLYVDGDKVAEENADAKSDWGDIGSNVWEMRFSGLSEFMAEDSNPEIVVAVTMLSNLDTDEEATRWYTWIPNNGIRARDGAGIDQYVGDNDARGSASYTRFFDTEGAGTDDELKISLSSSNPDASIIKVDENNTTDDVTILVFNMKAEGADITLDDMPITFTVPATEEFDEIVTDVTLEIDGELFSDYTTASSTTAGTATTTFNIDDDYTISENDTVTVKVLVDLNSTGTGGSNYPGGTTLKASLESYGVDDITGEGGDDLSASTNSGTAIGETHVLQAEGIFGEIVSITETKTAGDNNANDLGTYQFKIDVTAFDDTFYVSTSTAVIGYHIENGSGSTVTVGTTSLAMSSTATVESGWAYRIDDGATETFTVTLTLNPSAGEGSGYYRVELDSLDFGNAATTPTNQTAHTLSPDEDFESDDQYLNA